MSVVVEVKDLHKKFGDNEILKGIDFTVNYGEVVSVIGSSGSGKSTLLRCINMLETPEKGEILFHGQNMLQKGVNLPQYRAKLGMVFQQFNLFENLTVLKKSYISISPHEVNITLNETFIEPCATAIVTNKECVLIA